MKCELDFFACFAKMFYENHELQNFVENKIYLAEQFIVKILVFILASSK